MFTYGQVKYDFPVKKGKTSFAIITDTKTYTYCNAALISYRNAIERDGLSTYIVSANWTTPMQIRKELIKLYSKDHNLEGIVLVGDIPIAMIRKAQHLTTAFKMSEQKYPLSESSVPSDRFYDDLHLKFEYLSQDKKQLDYFYYNLSNDSPQHLNPTYYSARIKYPAKKGGDKYKAVSDFLNKAAKAKQEKSNKLNCVLSYTGSAYNTECLSAWLEEEKAYHENFPLIWKNSNSFKHYNFRMNNAMKYALINELQRPEVDLFIFHEHGLPTAQLINDEPAGNSFESRYNAIRKELYYAVRNAKKKGISQDSIKLKFIKRYHLLPSFFDKLQDSLMKRDDSISNSNCYLRTGELNKISTFPKIVILDACYNGSFQLDNYLAGYYLFNSGKTLVTQGNSANVLQDRWTTEMIGLLSYGVRVGQYNQLVSTLEGHLLGDPTVRFMPANDNTKLTEDIRLKAYQTAYWLNLLKSTSPDIQCLAMRKLCDINKLSSIALLNIYKNSLYNVVRMEALQLLSRFKDQNFIEAVKLGLNDPYEYVARKAAVYCGKIGDKSLLHTMADVYLKRGDRERQSYNLFTSFKAFYSADVINEVKEVIKSSNFDTDDIAKLTYIFNEEQRKIDEKMKGLIDKTTPEAKRVEYIREFRNNTCHYLIENLLKILLDKSESNEIRTNLAETLGWFDLSIERDKIIKTCRTILLDKENSTDLNKELIQTINRLN